MKIVVPVSSSDAHRLDNWVACVKKFAGLETHSIHFIPTFSVTAKAYEAAGKLGEACKDVRVTPLEMDSSLGWPKASNWQWFKTTEIMEELSTPWFWMELDCLPARSGWHTEIGSDYASCGTPFRGCVVKTPWKNDKGEEVESLDGPDDKMMCGCGIYPSNLHARFKQIQQPGIMLDFTKGADSADVPWDLHLRGVIRLLGMGHSDLFGDYWNTKNYRLDGDRLICDAKETDGDGRKVTVRRAGIVNPSAAVIHGCKDDSLFKLIMGGLDTRTLAPLPNAVLVASTKTENQATNTPEVDELRAQLEQMKALLTQVMVNQGAAANTKPAQEPFQGEVDPGYCEAPSPKKAFKLNKLAKV